MSDAELIECSVREPDCFGVIFDRHASEIHRFAARRLGGALAEDVVGEVFLLAFRRRESYDTAYRDARPWLYGIATNVIRHHHHIETRSCRALARTGVDPVTSGEDDVLARVAASAQRRALAAALSRLPAHDRDTLLLIVWGDLSYSQAARAVGVPVGTVRSRMNRARRKLRQALGGTSPADSEEESIS